MATLTSPEEMQAWGRKLAQVLQGGDVIALIGDLGAGKTTLVQGIAAGWGYRERANSPTFALVNEYHSRRGELRHMDMYRLSPAELDGFPLEEYLDHKSVCLIEWADRIRDRWPKETLQIRLKILDAATRQAEFYRPTQTWKKRLAALAS